MDKSSDQRRLSVILATRNRAAVLAETLEFFSQIDRSGLFVEFVVVDNDSVDDTQAVIEGFQRQLRIRYIYEGRAGKNRALNRALEEGKLQPLVVFTDDDVKPASDWFHSILAVSRRWPNHKIFGGRIVPSWPVTDPPAWVHDAHIRQLAFAAHDRWVEERPYPLTEQPFGPNFWLRREILDDDVRFDESLGPGTGTLGDEVMFLHQLQRRGFEIIYSPHACVEHRIQIDGLCARKLAARALMVGRIGPTMYGPCRPELLSRAPSIWKLFRRIRLAQARLALLRARLHPDAHQRIIRSVSPLINIGYNSESLRLANDHLATCIESLSGAGDSLAGRET